MKLFLRDGFDPDAWAYIKAVETADGQPLEPNVRRAIGRFVHGCKTDGVWTPIKSACILAGARTLAGALVPLVGTAPTNFNFVEGDYNRETGLAGNGSTKYLDTNRNITADPQNSRHLAVYAQGGGEPSTVNYLAGANFFVSTSNNGYLVLFQQSNEFRSVAMGTYTGSTGQINIANNPTATGFYGVARSASNSFNARLNTTTQTASTTSVANFSATVLVFARRSNGTPASFTAARLGFFSMGENLNLGLLNSRVSRLMSDIADAI